MRRTAGLALLLSTAVSLASFVTPVQAARDCFSDGAADIVGTNGNDRLRGTPGRDSIAALGGNDIVRGMGGRDYICGGKGDDLLLGGDGGDYIAGDGGDDTERGEAGRDILGGDIDPGSDYLDGGPGHDQCWINIYSDEASPSCESYGD